MITNESPESCLKDQAVNVARWIVFLPLALATGVAAWYVWAFLNRISVALSGFESPDGLLNQIWLRITADGVMGGAATYVGAYVAPFRRREIAIGMAGLCILVAGAELTLVLLRRDYWRLLQVAGLIIGGCVAAYYIVMETMKKEESVGW